ncbi:MAG: hypothetical protein JRM86_05575, partial [Nitrososphaerota archaeon]|nr:hypothetical protein [Nitrososphaerota archaeon]
MSLGPTRERLSPRERCSREGGMGRAGDELPWSSVGRKELGVAESERFAVGLGVPLEPPEKV